MRAEELTRPGRVNGTAQTTNLDRAARWVVCTGWVIRAGGGDFLCDWREFYRPEGSPENIFAGSFGLGHWGSGARGWRGGGKRRVHQAGATNAGARSRKEQEYWRGYADRPQ